MHAFGTILLLLAAVVASSFIARLSLRKLPLPLVQIALGAILAMTIDLRVAISPEVFLLLFITPLLFLDGWRIPKDGLFHNKWTIIALAFGLVLFTVIGAGFFIHWIIPPMPLSVAFALAAVVSPTDAVAVSAMSAQTPIPARLMHILEGESLLNDATGLVCFRFAVLATLTGEFSIGDAARSFSWTAIAGVGIGAAVAGAANFTKDLIARHFGEETGSQILISLLIPFGAYLAATGLEASGILATVAAGIVMYYEERSGRATAVTRIRRAAVWEAIQFAVNGAVFVVLGDQLPRIMAGADLVANEAGRANAWWLVGYIAAITVVITAMRGGWSWVALKLTSFRASAERQHLRIPTWYAVSVTSFAGVRGAVTLSAVMALPLTLKNGTPFPTRDLAIVLAAGVIIASLIAANVGLPAVARLAGQPAKSTFGEDATDTVRLAAAQAALKAVKVQTEAGNMDCDTTAICAKAAMRVIADYEQRIEIQSQSGDDLDLSHSIDAFERRLRRVALAAERDEYFRAAKAGKISDEATHALVREVDLLESKLL